MSNPDTRRGSSLATRVIIVALTAAVAIVGLLITFYSVQLSTLATSALHGRAEQVASLQASALVQPISDYDLDTARDMVTSLVTDAEMQAVRIVDPEGETIIETGEWLGDGSSVIVVEKPLEFDFGDGTELLGVFHLQVSTASVIEALNSGIWVGIVSIIVIALALWLVLALSLRQISRPLEQMIAVMAALTRGETEVDVPAQNRSDEIGEIANAVRVFKDNAIEASRLEAERVEQARKAEEDKRQALLGLADELEKGVKAIVEAVSSGSTAMQEAAESMSTTSEETSRQSQAAATASELASSNVQTVSAAAEEMSSSINEIARQVAQSATMAKAAVEDAQRTNQMVQGLAEGSEKIGEVIGIISDIASQTNLLALNATIEAARAGDAGKGFAVVASEVKSLANQTAKATEEIAAQIGAIQSSTEDAVGAISGIGEKIAEMDEVSTAIASAVEEQGAATGEISNNSQQAAAGTQKVSENIAAANQAASETGTVAEEVLQSAGDLSTQAALLRGEVDKFLTEVRAA